MDQIIRNILKAICVQPEIDIDEKRPFKLETRIKFSHLCPAWDETNIDEKRPFKLETRIKFNSGKWWINLT